MNIVRNIVANRHELVLPSIWGREFRFEIRPAENGWPLLSWGPLSAAEELKMEMDPNFRLTSESIRKKDMAIGFQSKASMEFTSSVPFQFANPHPLFSMGGKSLVLSIDIKYRDNFYEFMKKAFDGCEKGFIQEDLDKSYDRSAEEVVLPEEDLKFLEDTSVCILYNYHADNVGRINDLAGLAKSVPSIGKWLQSARPLGKAGYEWSCYMSLKGSLNEGFCEYLKDWVKRAK